MPSLVAEVDVPRVELALLVPALPALVARLRALEFGPDGVSVFAEGRREGLRMIAGRAGAVGACYRVVTRPQPTAELADPVPDPPFTVELVRDDLTELVVTYLADDGHGRIAVDDPQDPSCLRVSTVTPVPELTGRMAGLVGGSTLELTVESVVADLAGPRPAVLVQGGVGRVQGSAVLELARGPGPTDRARLRVELRLRGLLRPLGALWPLVRRRVQQAVLTDLPVLMAEVARETDWLLAEGSDPDVVAGRVVSGLPQVLAETAPSS